MHLPSLGGTDDIRKRTKQPVHIELTLKVADLTETLSTKTGSRGGPHGPCGAKVSVRVAGTGRRSRLWFIYRSFARVLGLCTLAYVKARAFAI